MFTRISRGSSALTQSLNLKLKLTGTRDELPGAVVKRARWRLVDSAPKGGEAPWLVWQERHSWQELGEATGSPGAPGRTCGRVS